MQLDSASIIVAGSSVLVLQGCFFVYFWWRDRTASWLLFWALPLIVGGASLWAYATTGWRFDSINIVFGNIIRLASLWSLWQGLRTFQGRPVIVWPVLLVSLAWLAVCLISPISDVVATRVEIISILSGLFCALGALDLRVRAKELLPSRGMLMGVFASFAVIMWVRAALAPYAPFPVGVQPVSSIWLAGYSLLVFGHFAFAAILFFAMTRERREEEQRGFAMSDPLTGLMNRRAFIDFAERADRRRSGLRRTLALLVLDLDHFKSINDRFGHDTGDRMLKAFAEVAAQCVRPDDRLFRVGGEEFCCVLPNADADEAQAIGERIRKAIEAVTLETPSGSAMTTVSVGLAASAHDVPIDVLVGAADAALYEAKSRGRNRVIVSGPDALRRPMEPSGDRRRA